MQQSFHSVPAAIAQGEPLRNGLATAKDTSREPRGNRFLILLSLLALYIIWGSTYLAMRIALLGAPIFWALGSAWSQHISLPAGLMSSSAQMLVGGVVLILLSMVTREGTPNLTISQSLWAIVYLVVFGSLVAFSAYGYLLRHVSPAL